VIAKCQFAYTLEREGLTEYPSITGFTDPYSDQAVGRSVSDIVSPTVDIVNDLFRSALLPYRRLIIRFQIRAIPSAPNGA
jgi:hypothetical protein